MPRTIGLHAAGNRIVGIVRGRTGRHHWLSLIEADGTHVMAASILFYGRHGWWWSCSHGPNGYRATRETAMRVAEREVRRDLRRNLDRARQSERRRQRRTRP